MGFFFCRRRRKSKRHSSPSSEFARTYQLSQTESLLPSVEHLEGTSAVLEDVPHETEKHPEGLSNKLRSRLSRDSKGLHTTPKRSDRQTGTSIFSFASRASKAVPAPIASGNFGSSLMSEKGYDNDAQCIDTPTQTNPSLLTITSTGDVVSPSDFSPKQLNGTRDEPCQPTSIPRLEYEETNGSRFSMDFLNNLSWSAPRLQGRPSLASTNMENARPTVANRLSSPVVEYTTQSRISSLGPRRDRARTSSGMSVPKASEPTHILQESHEQDVTAPMPADRLNTACQGLDVSQRVLSSLMKPPSQLQIPKKRKAPLKTLSPDAASASIHLPDLNISKMLASPSASPRVLSQNTQFSENGERPGLGPRAISEQENNYTGRNVSRSINSGSRVLNFDLPLVSHGNNTSSLYSRKASLSSAGASADIQTPEARVLSRIDQEYIKSQKGISTTVRSSTGPVRDFSPLILEVYSAQENWADNPSPRKSKFTEHFDLDQSTTSIGTCVNGNQDKDQDAPRKVSIGWMSGGRRLGYGYSLVSEDEGGQVQSPETETIRPMVKIPWKMPRRMSSFASSKDRDGGLLRKYTKKYRPLSQTLPLNTDHDDIQEIETDLPPSAEDPKDFFTVKDPKFWRKGVSYEVPLKTEPSDRMEDSNNPKTMAWEELEWRPEGEVYARDRISGSNPRLAAEPAHPARNGVSHSDNTESGVIIEDWASLYRECLERLHNPE